MTVASEELIGRNLDRPSFATPSLAPIGNDLDHGRPRIVSLMRLAAYEIARWKINGHAACPLRRSDGTSHREKLVTAQVYKLLRYSLEANT